MHPPNTTQETGVVVFPDCYNVTNGNTGCVIQETAGNSYGSAFATNGGGAYATLWDMDGIKMWFFPRPSIPADFNGTSPVPTSWGLPSAFFPTSTCDTSQFFGPQNIILNVDVCGTWPVNVWSPQACGAALCTDLIKNPANYDTAYFEIKSLRLFTENNGTIAAPTPTGADSISGAGPTGTEAGSSASNTSHSKSNASPLAVSWMFIASLTSFSMVVALVLSRGAFYA